MANIKGRNWAFVMYPDSMPQDWFEILQETGLPMAISPLHDKDKNPTGEDKKAHYHVICYYGNNTTSNNVKQNVCDLVNGTIPIKLESMQGMYRYHIHADNPEKYQYSDKDRTFINGFDVAKVDTLTSFEIDKILFELQQIVIDKHVLEYADLLDLLHDQDLMNMWAVAKSHTVFLKAYIDSRRFKTKQECTQNENNNTSHN